MPSFKTNYIFVKFNLCNLKSYWLLLNENKSFEDKSCVFVTDGPLILSFNRLSLISHSNTLKSILGYVNLT